MTVLVIYFTALIDRGHFQPREGRLFWPRAQPQQALGNRAASGRLVSRPF
jgi:hypothetical protein